MTDAQNLQNPFPGLRPFESDENHLFFGREDQIHALLRKLRRNRFVAVVGTSGSGKSSLVRAGLLPSLHGGFMTQAGSSWRIAIFRPGNDPIGNMARSLNTPEVFGETKLPAMDQAMIIETTLRRGDLGLVEASRQVRFQPHENLLLVVDQFEELFRFKKLVGDGDRGDEASAFVTLLLEAAKNAQIPIYIVLTMRSDFLGECSQFRDLPEAMNEGQYLVPRMTRDQRRTAIVGPVAVGGGEMALRLIQQLLNDVGDNPDQLPILQHAMMRTWNYWASNRKNGELLDLKHYEGIGTMHRALSLHADEAYNDLPDDRSKKIAEILFKTLSERGADNREIRRPTPLGQICAIAGASEKEVVSVIETFRQPGRSFLMPPLEVALQPNTLIDVSHESLIRNWELLKKWVDQEVQSVQIYKRLAETSELYQEGKAGYWRDPDLQIALNWQNETNPNEAWGQQYHPAFANAIAFLEESKTNRDTEIAESEAARERELQQAQALATEQGKAAKRLRLALILLSVLLLAAILAIVAFTQRQIAVEEAATSAIERQRAEAEKVQADSAAAAYAALFQEADSLQRIAANAAEAEKIARLESEEQRRLAIAARDTAGIERERAEAQALLAETRRNQAIAARDVALKSQQQVQAVALAINSQRLLQAGDDTLSALLALESYRFDDLSGHQFRNEVYHALRNSLNALSPQLGGPSTLETPTGLTTALDFAPGGNRLAIGGADSTVQLVNLDNQGQPTLLGKHNGMVTAAVFSLDGNHIASGGADYQIKIWNANNVNALPVILTGNDARVQSLIFDSSGEFLISGNTKGSLRIWNLKDSGQSTLLDELAGNILTLAMNKRSATLAAGSGDGSLQLWNLGDENTPVLLETRNYSSSLRAVSFNNTGDIMAIGFSDGTARLVGLTNQSERILRGHQKRINTIAFSPDGKWLASGSSDRTIRLWYLPQLDTDPVVLGGHASSIRKLAFTTDSNTLIAGTFGKEVLIWKTSTVQLVNALRRQVQRRLTLEEWQEFVGTEDEYPY